MGTYATESDWYAPPPPVRSFPSAAGTIHEWIQAGDTTRIRAHAWDVWESITTPSPQAATIPIWETWYAGHEIFDQPDSSRQLRRHRLRHRFELPRQRFHTRLPRQRRGLDEAERWFSFNRYTQPTASFIAQHGLWDYPVLADTNAAFSRLNTPVALREVSVTDSAVDPQSIVLKPVFEFIDGTKPSCITYWNGNTTATTTDTLNPIARTWKQWVIVDPTGSLKGPTAPSGGLQFCPPNDTLPLVPLTRFYAIKLTQEMVDSLSTFADSSGDDLGAGSDTGNVAIRQMAKPGNFGLLVAMHVTGKEIVEWTWQTFWWSPTPNDSLGYDRPKTIPPPWNNYQMNTAYQMVTPAHSKSSGKPRISFNPYLETSLCEKPEGPVQHCNPTSTWFGVQTNCMSCHRMAGWKTDTTITHAQKGDTMLTITKISLAGPPYVPAQWVDKGNPTFFGGVTKTDFLWSVAIRTANVPADTTESVNPRAKTK